MTSSIILRLVRRWYHPAEVGERERRTQHAHDRAIAIRVRSEDVDRRVTATRKSYESASGRMRRNGGHQ